MPAPRSAARVASSRARVAASTAASSTTQLSDGSFCGQMTVTRIGSAAARARTAAISRSPATVWLATTRMCLSALMIASL